MFHIFVVTITLTVVQNTRQHAITHHNVFIHERKTWLFLHKK